MQQLLCENSYLPNLSLLAVLCTVLVFGGEVDALYQYLASHAYHHTC